MSRRLLIAVLILLALLAGAALLGRVTPHSRARLPSSYRGEPEGLLAFRRLLDDLHVPTIVRSLPWDGLAGEDAEGVLLVATPLQRLVDAREEEALRVWLGRGGSLLVIDDATALERSPRLDAILDAAGLEGRPPLPEADPLTLLPARPPLGAASGTPARASGSDLRRLMLHAEGGLDASASGVPLALTARGDVVAAEGRLKEGRVVRVFGPLLANDRLLAGDNLPFALRLVEDLRGNRPVTFDEYHHGYGGMLPAARGLNRPALILAALQIVLVTALYAIARGVRFGPPRLAPEPLRRSSLEFVHSMADLYRRARATRHVVAAGLERFAREARARWDLGKDLASEELTRIVAARSGIAEGKIAAVLHAAEDARSRPKLGEKEMTSRSAELARLEREVFGGGSSGP